MIEIDQSALVAAFGSQSRRFEMTQWFELTVSLTDPATGAISEHVEKIDTNDIEEARAVVQRYLETESANKATVVNFVCCVRAEVSITPDKREVVTQAEREAAALLKGHKGSLISTDYVQLALEQNQRDLAQKIVDLTDKRPGWGADIYAALVEGLGIRKCLAYVYCTGDKNLAFHLSIHHEDELKNEVHDAILHVVILHNHEYGGGSFERWRNAPKYQPRISSVRRAIGNIRRARAVEDAKQSRRRKRKKSA